ncbi:MAG: biotin/lipoyl-binding protein [Pirellulales bacterium]|nr:biotin/lipoyl-binding protein [Pirellulales bacterium]
MSLATRQLPIPPEQPLRLRSRADLVASRHTFQGQDHWVLKDPLSLRYFRLQAEEYAIWELIDGRRSLNEIHVEMARRFPGIDLQITELWRFVASLFGMGLLLSDGPGLGKHLLRMQAERKRRQRTASMFNVLAVKLPGFDPTRILDALLPWTSWLFSPLAVMFNLLLGLAAAGLVLVQFETFQARLPAFEEFFAISNALWLAVALGFAKALHELGHGLSCKRYGGECHEMGVMFLVMTPCLYCDVTDSWMLPSKWKRAAIGAAGMYVEVTLAALCTFVWWFSEPGLLNHLALSLMFVCSVSTILFNANPLLRYDGYYILADLVEIPNLRQKSTAVFKRLLAWLSLGVLLPRDPFLPTRGLALFISYAVAAFAYRFVIVFAILWFLTSAFHPFGLKIIGQTLALIAGAGMLAIPLVRGASFAFQVVRSNQVNMFRLTITGLVFAGLAVIAFKAPLPHQVICALEIRPVQTESVYADFAGQLTEVAVTPGQTVQAGTVVAQLENIDLAYEIELLRQRRDSLEAQLVTLRRTRLRDQQAGAAIPAIQEALDGINEQLELKIEERTLLTIRAPRGGVVLPPPARPKPGRSEIELTTWTGSLLDRSNLGCRLDAGEMFCQIAGESGQAKAMLVIDQGEIEFINTGQEVTILLDQDTRRKVTGVIESVALKELSHVPPALSNKNGGPLPTMTEDDGRERPQSVIYQATVLINDPHGELRPGLVGQAKIEVGKQTFADRVGRYLAQTFRLR